MNTNYKLHDNWLGLKINVGYEKVMVYDVQNTPIIYQPNGLYIDMFNDNDQSVFNRNTIEQIKSKFKIDFPYKLIYNHDNELIKQFNLFYSYLFPFSIDYNVFNNGLISDFILKNEKFIYPIILADNNMFIRNSIIDIPQNIVNCIKNGQAKIVFCYLLEGHFGSTPSHYKWLSNLSKSYGFTKEDVIILTGNLISDDIQKSLINDNIIEDNFTVYPFSWFGNHIFFHQGGWKINTNIKSKAYESFCDSLHKNRTERKSFHFLSFNRLSKTHRLCIFGELKTNPIFNKKHIVSLGSVDTLNQVFPMTFMDMIKMEVKETYKHDRNKLIDFFKTHDSTQHVTYDCSDFENNKAEVLNKDAHNSTFLNIVNESLVNNNCVFFSEKIFKPIYMCQPFILFGNPYSLTKLKQIGYKTFDKWWDESYDNETDFTIRLEKIVDLMIEIASWDNDKLYRITNEMEETLFHNFNRMMSDVDTIELYKKLNTATNNPKNKII